MRSMKTRLAAGVTVAALAAAVAAPAALAQDVSTSTEIEDVEISSQSVFQGVEDVVDSIVQNGAASISVGEEFEVDQTVSDFQNATVTVDGDENEVEVEQDLEQNGFEAEVSTELSQVVSQASAAVFSF